jgi:two-component system cell cycle response regulator
MSPGGAAIGEEIAAEGRGGPPEPPRPKVALIVEDSRATRRIIMKMLEEDRLFDVLLEAENGQTGLRIAASQPVDLVLCDLDMPDLDGFGFLDRFRADTRNETVPVLMLSGTGANEKKVEGLHRGANDYIVKPCSRDELCARVRNYLRMKLLQDELKRKNHELESINAELARSAITDPLTGLHNRRFFMKRAQEEIKRALRHGRCFGLLMLDVDHFKRINDTFGHQVGDDVLVAVAGCLKKTLRESDLLARFGGEEFIIGLPETGREGSDTLADRLRQVVGGHAMPGLDRAVTVSVGVAYVPSAGVESVDQLISRADAALYRAKREGRNRVASDAPASTSG